MHARPYEMPEYPNFPDRAFPAVADGIPGAPGYPVAPGYPYFPERM